jgi:hypothetical protein
LGAKRIVVAAKKATALLYLPLEDSMKNEHYLLNEVARRLQVRPHKVVYAITSGQVEDVGLRIGGRRIFRPGDVQRLARHFGVRLKNEDKGEQCPTST